LSYPKGHPYGLHRVMEPAGALPQPAWKLNADPVVYDNELLIDVDCLNIDSASFQQLKEEARHDPGKVEEQILSIVSRRGKMHNPVTGSGGMLIGTVQESGPRFPSRNVKKGMKIATLVSLTLTPLRIEKIKKIHMDTGQVEIKGQAVLFASGPFALLPDDIPEKVALAVLDVCGAPAQTARLVRPQDRVVVLGAGESRGCSVCIRHGKKRASPGK
jgi:L-erythro-3,5-diaminohexanoate dehydrogenase